MDCVITCRDILNLGGAVWSLGGYNNAEVRSVKVFEGYVT